MKLGCTAKLTFRREDNDEPWDLGAPYSKTNPQWVLGKVSRNARSPKTAMLTMHEYGVLVGALLLVLEPVLVCVLPHRDELESTFYIYNKYIYIIYI